MAAVWRSSMGFTRQGWHQRQDSELLGLGSRFEVIR
jgi:hypothetical protein